MRKNKALFLLITLIVLYKDSFSQVTKIDLRDNLTDPTNYVGVVIRNNTSTGHAFVILGKENDKKQMSEMSLHGFYPKYNPVISSGTVKDDFKSLKYVRDADQLYFIVNDNDYNSAVKMVTEWVESPPIYNLISNNCIDLTQTVAEAIGVDLPSRLLHWGSLKPEAYLNLVKEKSKEQGLDYKNDLKIIFQPMGFYIGTVKKGTIIPNGSGKLVSATSQYKGQFKNGKPNGQGELTLKGSYNKIVGNFINGSPQGKVQIKHGSGDAISYVEMKEGKYVSSTETKYNDGSKRITQTDPDGLPQSSTYNGIDGSIETIKYDDKGAPITGTYTNSDKSVEITIDKYYPESNFIHGTIKGKDFTYTGDMKSFIYHGKGVLINGNNKSQGDFINGRLEGKNVHVEKDGMIFDGDIWYDSNHSYQKGSVRFPNGDTYTGELRDYKLHGVGRLVHIEQKKCKLWVFCSSNSYDITDTFKDGTSPGLQRMQVGAPPSVSFPNTELFKVPIDIPNKIEKFENKPNPNPNLDNIIPSDYSNLDSVPPLSTKPQLRNTQNWLWDPVRRKRLL